MISDLRNNMDIITVILVALVIFHIYQKSRGKKGVAK